MQPGSIVVVKQVPLGHWAPFIKWMPIQDEKTPYMVRDIREDSGSVILEEGIIGYSPKGVELSILRHYVREILPPGDLTKIIEECIYCPVPM